MLLLPYAATIMVQLNKQERLSVNRFWAPEPRFQFQALQPRSEFVVIKYDFQFTGCLSINTGSLLLQYNC